MKYTKQKDMKILYFAILYLANYVSSDRAPIVSVQFGIINIDPPTACNLTINDTVIQTDGHVPGLHYGLIHYDCGVYSGNIISKPRCFDCGIYCPYNDYILECKQYWLPALSGAMMATIIVTVIIMLYRLFAPKIMLMFRNKIKARKTKKVQKKLDHIEKHFKNKGLVVEHNYVEMLETPPEVPVRGPVEATVTIENINKTNVVVNDSEQYLRQPEVPEEVIRNDPNFVYMPRVPRVNMLLNVMLFLAFPILTMECDQTLFLTSQGKICDKDICQDINTYSFMFDSKRVVCFRTSLGDLAKFSIIDSKTVSIYSMIYKTSDFKINTTSTWRCKNAGLCSPKYCQLGSRHPDFKDISTVGSFSCKSDNLGCDYWAGCTYSSACTWYKWELIPAKPTYPVYKKVMKYWSFDLKVVRNNVTYKYSFDTNNPTNDINIGVLYGDSKLPISTTSVDFVDYLEEPYAINYEGNLILVDAAPINFPKANMIGDLQISLKDDKYKYPIQSVLCEVSGCNPICLAPESAIETLSKTKSLMSVDNYKFVDNYQVEIDHSLELHGQLTIGNVNFKNLYVEQAKCNLNVITTYGCIACGKLPYIVMQASEIDTSGILLFDSNCTFNNNYLTCSNKPYILQLKENYNTCRIHLINQNITFHIKINYEFYGDLTDYSLKVSARGDPVTLAEAIVNNPNFLESMTNMLFIYTAIVPLLTLLYKISLKYLVSRDIRNNMKD